MRLCLNFIRLKLITTMEVFQMPIAVHLINTLQGYKFVFRIDLTSSFWQQHLHQDAMIKTAFVFQQIQYCFMRVAFGLKQSPLEFQGVMAYILSPFEMLVESNILLMIYMCWEMILLSSTVYVNRC